MTRVKAKDGPAGVTQALIEQQAEARTRELFTLLEVSYNVASTLDLESLLESLFGS